jgi:hypothetical protein
MKDYIQLSITEHFKQQREVNFIFYPKEENHQSVIVREGEENVRPSAPKNGGVPSKGGRIFK